MRLQPLAPGAFIWEGRTLHQNEARLLGPRQVLGEDEADTAQPTGDQVYALFSQPWRCFEGLTQLNRLVVLDPAILATVSDDEISGFPYQFRDQVIHQPHFRYAARRLHEDVNAPASDVRIFLGD